MNQGLLGGVEKSLARVEENSSISIARRAMFHRLSSALEKANAPEEFISEQLKPVWTMPVDLFKKMLPNSDPETVSRCKKDPFILFSRTVGALSKAAKAVVHAINSKGNTEKALKGRRFDHRNVSFLA